VAANAVGKIGTNALPFLISWTEYRPPPWKVRGLQLARWLKSNGWGGETLFRELFKYEIRRTYASLGFEILGESAGPAAPELARIVNQRNRIEVIFALEHLGKNALPALTGLVTNTTLPVNSRGLAIFALGHISSRGKDLGTNARCVVPALVQSLKQPTLAIDAARTLGQFRLESELCVPALVRCMGSPDQRLQSEAARALGAFRKEAKAAVPELLRVLREPPGVIMADGFPEEPSSVRQAAKDALRFIAPEVLEKANQER
jgi:hypothetical protein